MVVAVGAGYPTLSRRFGLADLEPGDGLGGRARHFGEELVAVVDAEGGVGVFDGDGSTGVADADVDFLAGDDEDAAAAEASLDPQWRWRWLRWWSSGTGVTDAGLLGRGQRVGQAAQQHPIGVEQVQHAAVQADGDASSGEVVADGVLSAGEADQTDGVDEPVDLDGSPGLELGGGGPAGRPPSARS
ncbi:hypothetical protein [Micromonospora sp. CA-244673]|uniref:hypothetical protein n=1 Tax=Micromonospora sp. CA-244673 TaxID=3239958 RepID=UPI003D8D04FF